jgi:hypothetical protein
VQLSPAATGEVIYAESVGFVDTRSLDLQVAGLVAISSASTDKTFQRNLLP